MARKQCSVTLPSQFAPFHIPTQTGSERVLGRSPIKGLFVSLPADVRERYESSFLISLASVFSDPHPISHTDTPANP
jgi:hypothetical protein